MTLRSKRGCVSAVWHPIVFGGARDPGYDRLFWDMVEHVPGIGGLATDGSDDRRVLARAAHVVRELRVSPFGPLRHRRPTR